MFNHKRTAAGFDLEFAAIGAAADTGLLVVALGLAVGGCRRTLAR